VPAIETVCAAGSRDILVLTDGQTWASEVHAAASRGCRISAVLVGPASLDAMIGHLASITGGQVFYAEGRDVGPAVRSAIASMRSPAAPLVGSTLEGDPLTVSVVRGGVRIEATWETTRTDQALDAIGRYSASLALLLLDEQLATKFAVEHGLCSHLTSLVLVDEDGDSSERIPEMRQVPLALSAEKHIARYMDSRALNLKVRSDGWAAAYDFGGLADSAFEFDSSAFWKRPIEPPMNLRPAAAPDLNLTSEIDWNRLANALLAGDLSGLTLSQREAVRRLAQSMAVVDLAKAMGVDPVQIAIALLAEKENSRTAKRLARRTLAKAPESLLVRAKALTPSKSGER
jgi:hypothetical protein